MSKKSFLPIGRAELKYYFPSEIKQDIKNYILQYAKWDKYAESSPDNTYTVRSIYFDTEDFNFYYEKKDGLKIRKKLRLRSYNNFSDDSPFFLEIKRRYVNRIVKERTLVASDLVEFIHKECKIPVLQDNNSIQDKNVIEKYVYNLTRLNLRPTALITYDREAFQGFIDSRERVTIDKNLRSYIFPELCDLFREDDLKPVTSGKYILELKFDRYMPKWMGQLVHKFRLRSESIPKYCMGLEIWDNKPN